VGAAASSYQTTWTYLVCRHFGWDQRNFGVGGTGYVTAGGQAGATNYLGRVGEVAAEDPSIVIVSGGLNDYARGATDAEFVAAVNQTYAALRQALPRATIIGIRPFYTAAPEPDQLATMAGEVESAVQSVGGVYLDTGDPLLGLTQDISSDGVHPNDAGYAVLAQAVEAAYGAAF
jgi:lysophospholipase L1-like esterase